MKLFPTLSSFAAPQINITREKLAAVVEILKTVGLDEDDHMGFADYILQSDSYFGGTFEWTERFKGTRFYVIRDRNDNVTNVEVVSHGARPDADLSAAIDKANTDLRSLFAE